MQEIDSKNLREGKVQNIIGLARDMHEAHNSIQMGNDVRIRNADKREPKEDSLYQNVCQIYEKILLKRINEDYVNLVKWIEAFEGKELK